jgi:hypothetical protein
MGKVDDLGYDETRISYPRVKRPRMSYSDLCEKREPEYFLPILTHRRPENASSSHLPNSYPTTENT